MIETAKIETHQAPYPTRYLFKTSAWFAFSQVNEGDQVEKIARGS